jgi:hypothetical protein
VGWDKLPEPLGLVDLVGSRNTLREQNLFDTSRLPAANPVQPPPFEERFRYERTPDGSYGDALVDQDFLRSHEGGKLRLVDGMRLARHCPELKPYLDAVPNAFALWARAT